MTSVHASSIAGAGDLLGPRARRRGYTRANHSSRDLRKEPQSKKAESDEQQRTDPADVGALGEKEHSDDRGSRRPDADKRRIDRGRWQAFNGFGQQIVYRDRANDTDKQWSPSGYRR